MEKEIKKDFETELNVEEILCNNCIHYPENGGSCNGTCKTYAWLFRRID